MTVPPGCEPAEPTHVIYRCCRCKAAKRVLHPRVRRLWRTRNLRTDEWRDGYTTCYLWGGTWKEYPEPMLCPNECLERGHRVYMTGEPIKGRLSDKKCGSRCVNAVGPSCECSCAGKNHGSGYDG